jgi:hypothetical protein
VPTSAKQRTTSKLGPVKTETRHDLYDFMATATADMRAEYERIRKRSLEDPGTAGDQGEENWADLLRGWLPSNYAVCTKGRLLSTSGSTSPQVDVIVLKPGYPTSLRNKKHYLAQGVAAAFECKTTLRLRHVKEFIERCQETKLLFPARTGTPYKELHTPLIYGLLTHSSESSKGRPLNIDQIDKAIDSNFFCVTHPRYVPDLICVSDLGSWSSSFRTFVGPQTHPNWTDALAASLGPTGGTLGGLFVHAFFEGSRPIGSLIAEAITRLAWEDSTLRPFADYYRSVRLGGVPTGLFKRWTESIYTDNVRKRAEAGPLNDKTYWDEWAYSFH